MLVVAPVSVADNAFGVEMSRVPITKYSFGLDTQDCPEIAVQLTKALRLDGAQCDLQLDAALYLG